MAGPLSGGTPGIVPIDDASFVHIRFAEMWKNRSDIPGLHLIHGYIKYIEVNFSDNGNLSTEEVSDLKSHLDDILVNPKVDTVIKHNLFVQFANKHPDTVRDLCGIDNIEIQLSKLFNYFEISKNHKRKKSHTSNEDMNARKFSAEDPDDYDSDNQSEPDNSDAQIIKEKFLKNNPTKNTAKTAVLRLRNKSNKKSSNTVRKNKTPNITSDLVNCDMCNKDYLVGSMHICDINNSHENNNDNVCNSNTISDCNAKDNVVYTQNIPQNEILNSGETQNDDNCIEMTGEENGTFKEVQSSKKPKYTVYSEIQGNWISFLKKVENELGFEPEANLTGDLIRFRLFTDESFRALQNFLDAQNIKYQTLDPREERPKKFLLRGIPVDTQTDSIQEFLILKGFTPIKIAYLTNRKTKAPMPLFMVAIRPKIDIEDILNIRSFYGLKITVEEFKENKVKQCYNCQAYGHSSLTCKLTPKCVKCAGPHIAKNCELPKDDKNVKCANCGGNHPANYRGCPKNPYNKPKNQRIQNENETKMSQNNKIFIPAPLPPGVGMGEKTTHNGR